MCEIKKEINKDTEMHPLVRWQFRGGLKEDQRKGFLFTNIVDVKGNRYDNPVAVGALASSRKIYATALGLESSEEIAGLWKQALANPIEPKIVNTGACQEIVMAGEGLERVGISRFPIPISTPGFDNGPYITCGHWVSKDPNTGIIHSVNSKCESYFVKPQFKGTQLNMMRNYLCRCV